MSVTKTSQDKLICTDIIVAEFPSEIISIFHVCVVWIEKSVTRVTDRHH